MHITFHSNNQGKSTPPLAVRFSFPVARTLLHFATDLNPAVRYTGDHAEKPDVTPDVLVWIAQEYACHMHGEISAELESFIRTEAFSRLSEARGEESRRVFVRWFEQTIPGRITRRPEALLNQEKWRVVQYV